VCDRNECGGERARERALQLRLRVVPPEKSGWTVFHLQLGLPRRRRAARSHSTSVQKRFTGGEQSYRIIQDHTESYIIRISGALAFR